MDILQNNKPGAKLQNRLGLDYWSNLILLLYILTMPFVSAFAFTGTISLPLIFAVFLFILMIVKIIRSGKLPEGFLGFDLVIIFLFLFFVLFSFGINGWGNSKSLNHTVAYLSTFLLFYITVKFTFFNASDKNLLLKRVLQFITYTTIISALYGNVEFISSNVFGVNLNDYIPRPTEVEKFYNPSVLGLYYRARGFAPESGVYTQLLELFGPLTIYYLFFSKYCKWFKVFKILSAISIIFSIIFAASSATFIALPLSILFSLLVYIKHVVRFLAKKRWLFYFKSLCVVSAILIVNSYLSIYSSILLSITQKMDSSSLDQRQDKINFFFAQFSKFSFVNKLSGAGPAGSDVLGFEDSGTIISLYYNITFELGIIGLFLLLSFMGYLFLQNLSIKSKIGFFLMVSLISGITHYYVVHNFWVPWFWFIGAFIVFYKKTYNNDVLLKQ
jgi:hypothetical protein